MGREREREGGEGGAGQTYRQRQTKINREAGTNEERDRQEASSNFIVEKKMIV